MAIRRSAEQDLSKILFGQVHRLSVMAAIARSSGSVNPTDLAADLGLTQSAIQAPLRDLVDAGLLSHSLDGRRNVYTRATSKVWIWISELERTSRAADKKRTARRVR